jgi:hypothetical protein
MIGVSKVRIIRTNKVAPKKIIKNTLAQVEIGKQSSFDNMTMFPLLNAEGASPGYLTLDEALGRGLVQITEVSLQGSVPKLKLENESDKPVLLLDGEELIGAKQNRILNLTIMAPAKRTIVIPVSCVEAGRWSRRSAKFTTSSQAYFAKGRAKNMAQVSDSLKTGGQARSDQHRVWADIDLKATHLRTESPTAAMADIYEHYTKRTDEYVGAFAALDRQVGAAFSINGSIIGFDLFDSPATLKQILPKLVRSYALDAIETATEKPAAQSRASVEELFLAVVKAKANTFPAIGEGVDVRLTGPDLTGAALVTDGRVVHLSAFRQEPPAQQQN